MARDKDKEKTQEDEMLTTRNDPEEPNDPDVELDTPEQPDEESGGAVDTEYLMELITSRDDLIVNLQSRIKKLEKKKKAEDIGYLVNPVKVIAGLALSAEQLSTFKQTFPYLF